MLQQNCQGGADIVKVGLAMQSSSTDPNNSAALAAPSVAIYAIALNERKFVDRFMASCAEAEMVLVCDTGSTDGTQQRLRELGATVHEIVQKPWRFDIPRNKSLELVPDDIDLCVCLDLDEVMQPGWKEILSAFWRANGLFHRASYDFIWSWHADGTPDLRFNSDKIHSRQGWHWRHPCHETLYWKGEGEPVRVHIPGLQIQHHPDQTKSRAQYFPLLQMAVEEDPDNDRMRHYFARELMYVGRDEEAIAEFKIHLSLPKALWKEERAASWRYISQCQRKLGRKAESLASAIQGALEWPHARESWLEVARAAYHAGDWPTCYWGATKCLAITERTGSYLSRRECWGPEPYDLGALGAYHTGLAAKALELGLAAVSLNPNDERLQRNLSFYRGKAA